MPLSVVTDTFSAPAGTGASSTTAPGFQTKALIFPHTSQTATGSAADAHLGFGFTGTAAEDYNVYHNSLNAAASSDVMRSNLSTALLKTTVGGATTARSTATITSHDATGFTLNFSATRVGEKFPYFGIGGTDITDAVAGAVAMSTGTSNFSVTGLSFQPDIVFLTAVLLSTTGTVNNNNSICFGVAQSSSARWCATMKAQNAQATMNTSRAFYDNRCVIILQSTGDTAVDEVDFVSFNSDGFTLSHPTASGTAYLVHYLAIKGGQWAVGNFNQATSTGNTSPVTGLSFQPSATIFAHAGYETANTVTQTARMGVGFASSSSSRRAIWCGDEDNAANAKADQRYVEDKCIIMYDEVGGGAPTALSEADFVSNDSGGITINWTTADATARKVGYVCVGANAVGGTVVKDIISMGFIPFAR